MPVILTCPRGHQWPQEGALPKPGNARCPTCGVDFVVPAAAVTGAGNETLALGPAPQTEPRDQEKADLAPPPLPAIPGYEVLAELGRGGMGVVYKARELSLGRTVALKMVLAGAHAGSEEHKRFRNEAETLARLQHPNLVQIYNIGELEGKPYFSLEYIDGGDLESKFDGKPQPPEEAARLTATLARAVQVAHQSHIVHRDLKPANVLLTADGTPKITDFGLAKQLDSNQGGTRTGAIMGTPSYMSPEQAGGRSHEIGPHTDVYALGAMLYEFLTGRPPFLAESGWDTVLQVVNEEPLPPRKLQPKIPRDLETICLKCLEKEPRKRYASAAALADDLDRFVKHEPITARPTGPLERSWKWARRRPGLAAMGLAACLGLISLLSLGLAYHLHIQRVNEDHRRGLVRLSITQGSDRLSHGDWYGALVWYTYALEKDKDVAEREPMHRDQIAATFRPCPKLAGLWLLGDVIEHGSFSPDGKYFATACYDDKAHVFEVESLREVFAVEHGEDVIQVWFSHDGRRLLTASRDQTARVWDAASGRPVTPPLRHGAPLHSAYFNADSTQVITAGNERRAHVWDAVTGREVAPALEHDSAVEWAVFSPDGRFIATAGDDHAARVWDAKTHKPVTPALMHAANVTHVAFSPNSELLVSSGDDQVARLWRVGRDVPEDRRLVAVLPHNDVVRWGTFSPDGKRVLTISDDRTARLWDVTDGRIALPPMEHGSNVRRYPCFSPDGCLILTASDDNTARVWDAHDGQPETTHLTHNGTVHAVVASPDGHRVLTVSDDHTARLWDMATGSLQTDVQTNVKPPASNPMPLSPDGKRGVRFQGWQAILINPDTGSATAPPLKHDERLLAAAFSPDGRWLATASQDGTARLWNADTGEPRKSTIDQLPIVLRHASAVNNVAFSPNGDRVVTAAGDNTARIWSASSGALLTQPLYHRGSVNEAVFDPAGKRVVTASNDRTARIWDAATGAPMTPPLEHDRAVLQVRFGPDGRSMISTSRRNRRTWELPRETRDSALLLDMTQLLAGNRISDRSEYMPLGGVAQAAIWARLGGTQPELSAATPDEVRAWNRRRSAECERVRNWHGALWHLNHLVDAEPRNAEERLRRGDVHAELGHWTEALADYQVAAERATTRLDVQVHLALLSLQNNDRKNYEAICKALLERAGKDPEATERCVWLCNLSGTASLDRARVLSAAEGLSRQPGLLGAALVRAGKDAEAISTLKQALDGGSPESTREAALFRALALARLGQSDEARQAFRQAGEKSDLIAGDFSPPWPYRLALRWLSCDVEEKLGE